MQINYLRVVAEQKDAMMRLEADSTHALSRQHEEQAHKQHAFFHEFNSAIKDKDEAVHALQRELTNHKEHTFQKLEGARLEAEGLSERLRHVVAAGPSTQPYATPADSEEDHGECSGSSGLCCPCSNFTLQDFSASAREFASKEYRKQYDGSSCS